MIGRNKPAPILSDCPIVQYANGKTQGRMTIGSGRFGPLVGFYIECAKVDEAFAGMLQDAQVPQIEIKHPRQGGAEIVRHWYLGESLAFYPVMAGPPAATVAAALRAGAQAIAKSGVGVRWPEGQRSKVAVRGYLDILAKLGVAPLVQLSVKSKMSDVLLGVLTDHVRVCEAADGLIDRKKHPDLVECPEVLLTLVPGDEAEWGKADTATVTPFKSAHPATITAEYLRGAWRPDAIHVTARSDWDSVVDWAHAYATNSASPGADGDDRDEA